MPSALPTPDACCPSCPDDSSTSIPGAPGTNGATWRSGTTAPSNSLGVDGDFYLRTSTGDIYLKSSGSYSIIMNIEGTDGTSVTVYDQALEPVSAIPGDIWIIP